MNKQVQQEIEPQVQQNDYKNIQQKNVKENIVQEEVLTKQEKSKIRKAAQDEFKQKLKKAQQAEAEYKAAYNKVYNDYLKKMGFKPKASWTLKRIGNLIITILIIIILAVIFWHIPPVKNMLYSLYDENFIIKAIVDLIRTVINLILGK